MALNVKRIEAAKPKEKLYRLADERGLYLEIPKTGSKRWRFRYRFDGKEKMLSLGVYPDITLRDARDKREEYRSLIAKGINPGEIRKDKKEEARQEADTFEIVARDWFEASKGDWTKGHSITIMSRLTNNVLPWIGSTPIKEINAPTLLPILKRIQSRGAVETAHRVRGIIGQVFRWAVVNGRADRDPAADLKGAIPPRKHNHLASITDPKKIPALLKAIDGYEGHHATRCALQLSALTFVRPGELRHAEWKEIDFDGEFQIADEKARLKTIKCPAWCIPAEKMKARRPHIIPLAGQAVDILKDLHPLTGQGKYVFPSVRSAGYPMSENTVNGALRRLGYTKEEMCAHGFRSMASTRLNEMGWNRDWVERQLAHVEENKVRGAYNRAEFLPSRIKMMQAWADYLDGLKDGGKVIPIKALNE
ncbi:tyrosine-type recombinase/integrase [Pseudodesulfovibrio sp.]|nr:tyrosine-type recombinase/integrase [Pseudodesulfovibrio sp.]